MREWCHVAGIQLHDTLELNHAKVVIIVGIAVVMMNNNKRLEERMAIHVFMETR